MRRHGGARVSWLLEDSLRVTIENDPDLVSSFTEWCEDHPDVEVISRIANYDSLRAVFHSKHRDDLVRVLSGLYTEAHREDA